MRLVSALIGVSVAAAVWVTSPLVGWAGTPDARAGGENPYPWLERMRDAARNLNYEGTFVYRHQNQLETMRVVHRAGADGGYERLVSLSGARRELVRAPQRVTCVRDDERSVLVDESRGQGLLGGWNGLSDRVAEYYHLTLGERARVAGRSARLLEVRPKDEYRYGFRLWLDDATALLLRSELLGERDTVLEEFLFTSIAMPESIPDSLLAPEVANDGFSWRTTREGGESVPPGELVWQFHWVPPGFSRMVYTRERLSGTEREVEHAVFSDGIAAFSVYIEAAPAHANLREGLRTVGAVNAFGRRVGDFLVTVVGEVPGQTVDRVGSSVRRK
jgi:sigma-E factor negative regulatory protein RseB